VVSETTPEKEWPKRRPPDALMTRLMAVLLGGRPEDKAVHRAARRLTMLGVIAAVLAKLLAIFGGYFEAQTVALRELPRAVAQAIKERDELRQGDAAWVVAEVRALRDETAQHQAADAVEFAQLRGVVAGRLKCPPCPACPACPPASLGVPKQPDPGWLPRER
jgi:hypothetical protein